MSIRKIITIVLVLLLLFPVEGVGQGKPGSFKPGSEPEGFRGIKWGTDISTIKDMEVNQEGKHFRKSDKLKIGEAELNSIEYGFHKGKFDFVLIKIKDQDNFSKLRNICFELFGPVAPINQDYRYVWEGKKTVISLDGSGLSLYLWSVKYAKLREKENQRKEENLKQKLRDAKKDF